MTLGLVCDVCDALSALSATVCVSCGETLGVTPRSRPTPQPAAARHGTSPPGVIAALGGRPGTASSPGRLATAPQKARGKTPPPPVASPSAPTVAAASLKTCRVCGASVPPNHRFCGNCGARIEPTDSSGPTGQQPPKSGKTLFFGAMQQPGRAKLILIKGEGMDGVSYHLAGEEHLAGRLEGAILFPEDPLLSPRHANFFYRDGKLFVRDEGSLNGVFVRIKAPVTVEHGATFLVGEQLLRIEATAPDAVPQPDDEGTYFYGSPKRPARMCLVQLLAGGEVGITFRARSETISVGREGNDVNFPSDPFISGRHASVAAVEGGRFHLTDLGSRNGTFLRVRGDHPLFHGDYVFLGQQLLRVEIV